MRSARRTSRLLIATAALLAPLGALVAPDLASADPPDRRATDTRFSIAVIPDTQLEVLSRRDTRFRDRTRWLANQRRELDLRFVAHTGDVVNWGWLAPSQYAIADRAMKVLDRAHIPYSLAVGNHDTRAVGVGGSDYASNAACFARFSRAECNAVLLLRHTEEFNATFSVSRMRGLGGTFEPGKVDNAFSTFRAGGADWLVLTLEMWPRRAVVEWASAVVAQNRDANVIVQTHQYLNTDGSITQFNSTASLSSPQYVFDHLIRRHPNIKLVLSGHNGTTANRTDTGDAGNKIVSVLNAIHSETTNPVRLIEFDTATDTARTWLHSPSTRSTSPTVTFSGLSFD